MPKLSLHTLLAGLLGLMVTVGAIIFGSILVNQHQMQEMTERVLARHVMVMDKAHALKLHVVQVQQWLTDISATRGLDGLNDGFDEAAAHAGEFQELLKELEQIDPDGRASYRSMQPVFDSYYSVGQRMAQAYVDRGPAGGNALMAEFDAVAAAMSEKIDLFVEKSRKAVDEGRTGSIDLITSLGYTSWIGAVVFILVLGAMGWVFRSVLRQVGHDPAELETIAARIADGRLELDASPKQEKATGVYAALLRMREQLSAQISKINAQAVENGRMRSALDHATSPITVSDDTNTLIYLNHAARKLFGRLEEDIRRQHPTFAVADLVGRNLGDFFSDPDIRRSYANPLQESTSLTTQLGSRSLTLATSPILDSEGQYLGRISEWRDITDELLEQQQEAERIEEERKVSAANLRLKVALDNVSSNVMVADESHRIIYVNETALRLFSDAEADIRKELPNFEAKRLLGANIDTFHSNPAHQRGLVEGLRDTHRATFEIGGLTMHFVANPVIDSAGNHLGTVVEWTDRTAEIAVEREVDELVAAARAGDLGRRVGLTGKQGFFHQLGANFNALLDELDGVFGNIADVMAQLAKGDLNRSIQHDYAGTFGRVKGDVNAMIDRLSAIVSDLRDATARIEAGAEEINQGNAHLSARTEQQASSLEQTASSMEQLTATVRNNAGNAQEANRIATTAMQAAERGGTVVANAIQAMDQINASSNKIAEIIGVIDEI
ncbi:MAG: PAS domain-containing protein, partial [Gammaproteobacteria bacterium]|nr:PAS domain-containing protein [Gammaproteobacteria bacterium]